ncbi:MAG: CZB domain-containing protein [Hydrogenobacter sp.]
MDIRLYISQHELYPKKLKLAIKNKRPFAHKECCRDTKTNCCAFGERFYTEIMPRLEGFPEEIRQIVLQIEDKHCQFHEIGKKIDIQNPDMELVKKMEDITFEVHKLLLRLEKKLNGLAQD